MDTMRSEHLSKFGQLTTSFDRLSAERVASLEKDDNTPWLITLADLLAILLVFSFVMFGLSGRAHVSELYAPAQKNIRSLVSVAEATVNNSSSHLAIPLGLCAPGALKKQQPDADEKTVLQNSFRVSHAAAGLSALEKSRLDYMAQLFRMNPSSKIIVTANIDDPAGLSVRSAKEITSYLTAACGIDKKNVYLQAFPDAVRSRAGRESAAQNTEQQVDVKLLKDFWGL